MQMRRALAMITVGALMCMLMPIAAAAESNSSCSKSSPFTVKLTDSDSFGTQICGFSATCPTVTPCELRATVDVYGIGKPSAGLRIGSRPPFTCGAAPQGCVMQSRTSFTGTTRVECWMPAQAGTVAVNVNLLCTVASSTAFVR